MSETHLQYPQGSTFLRNLTRNYPVIERGDGVRLFDRSGKDYIDASSGALVVSVGHSHPEVLQDYFSLMSPVSYLNGMQFASPVTEELSARLAELAQQELGTDYRTMFLSSGSEAVEASIKLARQIATEHDQMEKSTLLARTPSYHGNTLFALSASDRPHYKKGLEPILHQVDTIPAPYEYRPPAEGFTSESYTQPLSQRLDTNPNIFAFIYEPCGGSATGACPPPAGYLKSVSDICRQNEVVTIADEVLVGSGRTGKFFASAWEADAAPDIIVLGKGLNGGYAPLSAMMVREELVDEIKRGSGKFLHAQTYINSPATCAAGVAVLRTMEKQGVIEEAAKNAKHLESLLDREIRPFESVAQISHRGMLFGVELALPGTASPRAPYPRNKQVSEKLFNLALENGLTLWTNVGAVDGHSGDLFLLGPPLTSTPDELTELVDRLKVTLKSLEELL